jgi:hypothetical protein
MHRNLIAVPTAALIGAAALVAGPLPTAAVAADSGVDVATYKNDRPVTHAHFSKYRLKNWELKQIAKSKVWARSPKARSVIRCESGGDYTMIDRQYHGAWQFLNSTWAGVGGRRYAPSADRAPKFAQDHMAWRLWKRSGWGPWTCA